MELDVGIDNAWSGCGIVSVYDKYKHRKTDKTIFLLSINNIITFGGTAMSYVQNSRRRLDVRDGVGKRLKRKKIELIFHSRLRLSSLYKYTKHSVWLQ